MRDGAARTVVGHTSGAIALAVEEGTAGDVVVIAGKGHEQGQERHGVRAPFDDRVVAREAIEGAMNQGTRVWGLTVNEILRSVPSPGSPSAPRTPRSRARSWTRERVVPGALFVGVRGEAADGGQHAPDALRDGAAAARVGESAWRWIEGECLGMRRPVVVAPDPVAVLQAAGRLALERSGARVVGITGATGKTTTKDMVAMPRATGVAAEGPPATATRRSASRCP